MDGTEHREKHSDSFLGCGWVCFNSGIRTTCQFNSKVFYPRRRKESSSSSGEDKQDDDDDDKTDNNNNKHRAPLWCSDTLENHGFDEDGVSFFADNVAVTLSDNDAESDYYTIKSAVNEKSIVNLKVTRTAPGFQVGKDGTSYYGTDPSQPWGRMRHTFWPRCKVEGTIITETEELDFRGRAFFVHALQGMKPHHAGQSHFNSSEPAAHNKIHPPIYHISVRYLTTMINTDIYMTRLD